MIYSCENEEATEKLGAKLASFFKKGSIIALSGPLAAGKSVFCRGVVKHFLPNAVVKSPTYTIINEYHAPVGTILHIDAYRLRDAEELLYCGFDVYEDNYYLCLIEWSENVEDMLKTRLDVVRISFAKSDSNPQERTIEIEGLEKNIIL